MFRSITVCSFLFSFLATAIAIEHPEQLAPELILTLQTKTDHIIKKCVSKAMLIREERVCESKKSAIAACLQTEIRFKDLDSAVRICEKTFMN